LAARRERGAGAGDDSRRPGHADGYRDRSVGSGTFGRRDHADRSAEDLRAKRRGRPLRFFHVDPGYLSSNGYESGLQRLSQSDFAIVAGTVSTLNVTLGQPTLTSLREVGRVTVNTGRRFQQFARLGRDRIASDLRRPGAAAGRAHSQWNARHRQQLARGVNNASPGAITFPNIRGALSFETAALIDGHPISVGQYGDYVTTFLNSYILQSVEVIKGSGAASPTISRAIGGTVNFRTIDPSAHPSGPITVGLDSFGGIFSNFGAS